MGDQSYSSSKKCNWLSNIPIFILSILKIGIVDENRRVLIEKRNIQTKPLKEGRYGEAYFSNMLIEDKDVQQRLKDQAKKELRDKLSKVKQRKLDKQHFKQAFRPASVHHYTN